MRRCETQTFLVGEIPHIRKGERCRTRRDWCIPERKGRHRGAGGRFWAAERRRRIEEAEFLARWKEWVDSDVNDGGWEFNFFPKSDGMVNKFNNPNGGIKLSEFVSPEVLEIFAKEKAFWQRIGGF